MLTAAAWAAPGSLSLVGNLVHGQAATVTGSSFGSKSPAAPLWWDDTEGGTDGALVPESGEMTWVTSTLIGSNKHYNEVAPTGVTENSGYSNIRYRNVGEKSISGPHDKSTKYIMGCHDDQGECAGGEVGQNVGLNVSDASTHDDWYVSYYVRLDSAWPAFNSYNNYKFFVWEAAAPYDIYSSGGTNYEAAGGCSGGTTGNRRSPQCDDDWIAPNIYYIQGSNCGDGNSYPVVTESTDVTNPLKEWVRAERILDYTGDYYRVLYDNVPMYDTTVDGDCTLSLNNGSAIGGATLEGFWKRCDCFPGDPGTCVAPESGTGDMLDDDACRFFDDVYIDTTMARVMLCTSQTYPTAASATCEPQIPSAWSTTSITFTVNQGAIAGGTAYLFVFDSANDSNATGLAVTLAPSQPMETIFSGVSEN